MERILNEDEKIKRAEEIYFRRNNQNISLLNKEKPKSKKSVKDKFFLQLIIMLDIAIIVFCIQNKDFIFKEEFLNTLNEYNVNISSGIVNFIGTLVNSEEDTTTVNDSTNEEVVNNVEENIVPENQEITATDISSSINEMDIDVENLKAAYSLINPIEGTVTSVFGSRESENKNVEGYHTGIDIAAESGTDIKSSFDGIVTLVSNEGDYGKHLKVRCNNVTMLYAHCSKILVKEGQIVGKGQIIAKVGSTGNSTGPHLHFEIRVDDRFVDPLKILKI